MRYVLVLAGLAAMVAAAPMKMSSEQMAGDNWYVNYTPYAKYDPYPKAVEDMASKMQADAMALNMKRNAEMGMAHDINYSKYAGYKPYASYVPYSAAVQEAAKMDMERRDMLNSLHDSHVAETNKLMMDMEQQKRDDAHMADNSAYSTYPSYPKYDPYGKYPANVEHAAGAEMAEAMQKRHEMMLHIPEPAMGDAHKRDLMNAECEMRDGNMAWCIGKAEEGMMSD